MEKSFDEIVVVAWTGGSPPRKFLQCSKGERAVRSRIFRDHMKICHDYWGDYLGLNESVLETARIYYNWARHDAHATFRHLEEDS